MIEKTHATPCGTIHYWVSEAPETDAALVLLPGLTADHRLFARQVEGFEGKFRLLTWDAPGHAASWPFQLTFTLADKARWLDEILTAEGITRPVLVGQSMGGYLGQMYLQLFPGKAAGFVSIDSAPLQRRYYTAAELWLLKRMEPVYRRYPWKALLRSGSSGVATTAYGQQLMRAMMMTYDGDQQRYAAVAGHGYRMLAEAVEADRPYRIDCPALLLCGEEDRAGSTRRYNRAWARTSGFRLEWIRKAGHNANTDRPEEVNALLEAFAAQIGLEPQK